jgi:hypothetical protein
MNKVSLLEGGDRSPPFKGEEIVFFLSRKRTLNCFSFPTTFGMLMITPPETAGFLVGKEKRREFVVL